MQLYNDGAFKMVHPEQNIFRLRNKQLERSNKTILAYKYLPDRARSMAAYQEFKDSHLDKDHYDKNSPTLSTTWIRPRVQDREMHRRMRYSTKTDQERINGLIRNSSSINHEPLNTDLLI